jgi:hypothetical protein
MAVHHEGTKGTKGHEGIPVRDGPLAPDNINNFVMAPLPDGFRAPSPLRALRAFVVNTDTI